MRPFDTPCMVLRDGHVCGRDSFYRYEAYPKGFMYLCVMHGKPHTRISERADGLIGDIYAEAINERSDGRRIPHSTGPGYQNQTAASHLRRLGLTMSAMTMLLQCSPSAVNRLLRGYGWSEVKIDLLRKILTPDAATYPATSHPSHGL